MKYLELAVFSSREDSENTQAALIQAGLTSMRIDDSSVAKDILADPGLYKYDYLSDEIRDLAENEPEDIRITLYFSDDEEGQRQLRETEELIAELKERGGLSVGCESTVTGDDSEWLYKWQENFKPTKVGKRIVVKPGWEEYSPAGDELVIEMEPGMAFGSGLHETTRMCIEGLEKTLGGEYDKETGGAFFDRKAATVLDVGTGTGILSMAAVLLGAKEALGIDIDDEAVRVASENIDKNGLSEKISVRKGDLMEGVEYEPDIIVANLMADLVMMLSPSAADQLGPGGIYITSGILDIKVDAVAEAIANAGFDIIEILIEGEWRAVIAVRKTDK